MVVSLAGFVNACYRNTFLIRLYLVVMFMVIAVLIGFIIFAYVVTDKGSSWRRVMNQAYSEYYLEDYWKIGSCIRDSHVCARMGRTINGVPETARMGTIRHLTPIQTNEIAIYIAIKPLDDRVLIKVKEAEEKNKGKTVGKTKVNVSVKIGEQVVYLKYIGIEVEFNGTKHLIVKDYDIVSCAQMVVEAEEKTPTSLLLTKATKEKPSVGMGSNVE
ncbi:chaperonin GroES [Vigna unguiculata]|uniref:Chaperonin GroES n=1 Tax=Vigna unguiculata TaxID=3917 RepID=A0A4D6LP46_VIGUN|nr:chaperonin GroES [Vigna unguiculata]